LGRDAGGRQTDRNTCRGGPLWPPVEAGTEARPYPRPASVVYMVPNGGKSPLKFLRPDLLPANRP
jgi:hypothetical protein